MSATPQLSVVVPVHNEEDNVAPLVGEIVAALRGKIDFEIVYVDDDSRDDDSKDDDSNDDDSRERPQRHSKSKSLKRSVPACYTVAVTTADGSSLSASISRSSSLSSDG